MERRLGLFGRPELTVDWKKFHLSRGKLKASSKTSALLAGFSVVPLVEVELNNKEDNPIPPSLLIVFGVCTVLLVSVHMLALMMSTCILPHVEAVNAIVKRKNCSNLLKDSPHNKMRHFIEVSWLFSNVIGVFLFLIEVVILFWMKFWELGKKLDKF